MAGRGSLTSTISDVSPSPTWGSFNWATAASASEENSNRTRPLSSASDTAIRHRAPEQPRNSDGNPDSPQAVVFLMSIIDVRVGC